MKVTTASVIAICIICIALAGLALGVLLRPMLVKPKVPYILEYMGGGSVGQELALMGLETNHGNGVEFFIDLPGEPEEKERIIWSAIAFHQTDRKQFIYLDGLFYYLDHDTVIKSCQGEDAEEKPGDYAYLYVYRFFNDTTQPVVLKPDVLYALTGTTLEIRPGEIANLFLMSNHPPKTVQATLEVLEEVRAYKSVVIKYKPLPATVSIDIEVPDLESPPIVRTEIKLSDFETETQDIP